jgi:hypothetical protein
MWRRLWLMGCGQVNGRCGAQQNFRDAILRSAFRAGVAADADALLPAACPEPAVFLTQDSAVRIEKGEANGTVPGYLYEIGAVLLHWRSSEHSWVAIGVFGLKAHRGWSSLQRSIARKG